MSFSLLFCYQNRYASLSSALVCSFTCFKLLVVPGIKEISLTSPFFLNNQKTFLAHKTSCLTGLNQYDSTYGYHPVVLPVLRLSQRAFYKTSSKVGNMARDVNQLCNTFTQDYSWNVKKSRTFTQSLITCLTAVEEQHTQFRKDHANENNHLVLYYSCHGKKLDHDNVYVHG